MYVAVADAAYFCYDAAPSPALSRRVLWPVAAPWGAMTYRSRDLAEAGGSRAEDCQNGFGLGAGMAAEYSARKLWLVLWQNSD